MTGFRERVWPSVWMFVIGVLAVPSLILVFAPINVPIGIIVGVAVYAGYVVFLVASSPIIEVTHDQLRVSSARIPLQFTGKVEANLTREAARQAAGPGLDARAWLCLRGWVPTSVRVDVTDVNDPVPYWLFSTREPEAVRKALEAARAGLPKS